MDVSCQIVYFNTQTTSSSPGMGYILEMTMSKNIHEPRVLLQQVPLPDLSPLQDYE